MTTANRLELTPKRVRHLLDSIGKHERKLRQSKYASPHYWNGDTWGSISGIRDANEWVDCELAKFVNKRLRSALQSAIGVGGGRA